jgi:iron-sulfur cluster repair protein YtfE (RIC family)
MTGVDGKQRSMILAQHAFLRETIQAAQDAAHDAVGRARPTKRLREMVDRLCDEVVRHLDAEEEILAPFFSQHDARAVSHASLMRAEHAHERAVLSMLRNFATWLASDAIAERVLSLCDHLLADMEFEERELFSPAADAKTVAR